MLLVLLWNWEFGFKNISKTGIQNLSVGDREGFIMMVTYKLSLERCRTLLITLLIINYDSFLEEGIIYKDDDSWKSLGQGHIQCYKNLGVYGGTSALEGCWEGKLAPIVRTKLTKWTLYTLLCITKRCTDSGVKLLLSF